jgi:hypothetical protein
VDHQTVPNRGTHLIHVITSWTNSRRADSDCHSNAWKASWYRHSVLSVLRALWYSSRLSCGDVTRSPDGKCTDQAR